MLAPFNPRLETALQTDASKRNGFGFVLMQKHPDAWKLVMCGSRFVTDTESRYEVTALELRAAEWAMKKCSLYLLGLPEFKLIVDHQALVTILDKHTLDCVENPRLQRMKERISQFTFKTVWKKGNQHSIPDALSRAPVADPSEEDKEDDAETTAHINAIINSAIISDEEEQEPTADAYIEELKKTAHTDADYQVLIETIVNGFPKAIERTLEAARPFWKVRDNLSTDQGLVLFHKRIVIPKIARGEVIRRLHASHQGIERTKRRARQTVYWPGITSDITNAVSSCSSCQERLPSQQKEPLRSDHHPTRIFEDTSADLFTYQGRHYLAYADRYSGWTTVDTWKKDPSAKEVIRALAQRFADLGVPNRFSSDGGPQFTAREFQEFLQKWGVTHSRSTPYYAQSNGHAEAAVKAMKSLVAKTTVNGDLDCDSFRQGLLEWRNTPRKDGKSPAEILFGHPQRTLVPAHHSMFQTGWQQVREELDNQARDTVEKNRQRYDIHAKQLQKLNIGAEVRIQHPTSKRWDATGTVIAVGRNRDYRIKSPSGVIYWRNRRFLRQIPAQPEPPDPKTCETASGKEGDAAEEKREQPRRSTRGKKPARYQ